MLSFFAILVHHFITSGPKLKPLSTGCENISLETNVGLTVALELKSGVIKYWQEKQATPLNSQLLYFLRKNSVSAKDASTRMCSAKLASFIKYQFLIETLT